MPPPSAQGSASPQSYHLESVSDADPEIKARAATMTKLKGLARDAQTARVPYTDDGSMHHQTFRRAVSNVLSTELALFTFAQIIDGLPTADVAYDRRFPGLDGVVHPIEEHPNLCPGVMERTREIRDRFDRSILLFDLTVIRAYRRAVPGSQRFNIRFMELVAVSMHQLGTLLFNLEECMHKGGPQDIERITQYLEPPSSPGGFHHGYLADDIYPEGVADVVGYWTEDRILGGVTVFDRQAEQRTPKEPPNTWFYGCRENVTYRYFQLQDQQQQAMVDFFLADDPGQAPCPLPIIGDKNNRVRVDFWKALTERFICRDVWERKPPTNETIRFWERRPQNEFDYPEHRTLLEAVNTRLGIPFPAPASEQDSCCDAATDKAECVCPKGDPDRKMGS
ncbi:hypothetical protein C8A05DRAFT_46220 [Staphylotrichum tortipilum]|uniref:Uncharacterized protein n=1 Tax=Staphylotrichum tortipilum TaxID=2831512 RepID=A0AAN6RR16_9PEZI|nr:hypothetical protein C8A05DRAFT_46220 [Staphylotrichum longicolle]